MPKSKPDPPKPGSSPPSSVAQCPHEGSKTNNNRIDLEFDPDKSTKVTKCEKIVHVQFCRLTADGTMVKPGDCWNGWKFRDKIMTGDGWWIDCLAGEATPDYQQGTGDGSKNGGSTKATMNDTPNIRNFVPNGFYDGGSNPGGTKKFVMEFFTYGWCMKGPDCGKWYEGVKWEYVKTWENHRDGKDGTSTILDKNLSPPPGASQIDAFNNFNKEHSFTPCT